MIKTALSPPPPILIWFSCSAWALLFLVSPSLQGIFLVYDITSERSFQHIMKWASDVDEVSVETFSNAWLMLPWSRSGFFCAGGPVFLLVVLFHLCLNEAVSFPASSWSPARWFNWIDLLIMDLISSWVLSSYFYSADVYVSFPELSPSCGLSPQFSSHLKSVCALLLPFPFPPLLNVQPVATLLQYAPDQVQKILVGNKSDEVEKRQVATTQGIKVGCSVAKISKMHDTVLHLVY